MNNYRLTNARVLQTGSERHGCDLIVENNIVTSIAPHHQTNPSAPNLPVINLADHWIATAPIEFHIHGAGPFGFEMDLPDVLEKGVRFLQQRGTGWVMPTLAWSEPALLRLVQELESKPWLQSVVPGIYIEGPFINPQKRGGIQPEMISNPNVDELNRILDLGKGFIRAITIAPELPGADRLISTMRNRDVRPCFGHSIATARQANDLIGNQPVNTTHLFNAMSGFLHRDTGLAGLPFINSEVFFELNGDLVHVSPDMLKLCSSALDPSRRILITDAVISAGLPHGDYQYFSKPVRSSSDGVRFQPSGTLIGSNQLIFDVVRNMRTVTHEPLHRLWDSVTTVPFAFLKLKNAAPVNVGAPARLVAFDVNLHVSHTFGFPSP